MKKLVLIDGHSILNRAFYGLPNLSNSKGIHTNAVFGFLNIMLRILEDEKADYLAVAFDLSAPTFRHLEYSEYKANRRSMPSELREQIPLMKSVLESMNISILSKEGFEADDILGTVSKKFAKNDLKVSIISGDRDLLQLADENIKIRIPKTVKGQTIIKDYYPKDILEEYGVSPLEFIDLKALMGDNSDNIKGVKGIGEKSATKIISQFHSIENAYENFESITPKRIGLLLKEDYESAVFSKFLATIKTDVNLDINLDDMLIDDIYNQNSFEFISKLEFKSLYKYFNIKDIKENIEVNYEYIDDFKKAISILKNIKFKEMATVECIYSKTSLYNIFDILAISICFEKNKVYIFACNEKDNLKILTEICKRDIDLYTLDLKNILKSLNIKQKEKFYDLSLAAYLINPLNDTYDTKDIARDFLDINMISEQELFNKKDIICELKNDNIKAREYFAKKSLILFLSKDNIFKKLDELEMMDLYKNIELPLVYSLAKMEMSGILVDENRLKLYADELKLGIAKLESEIYKESGSEFNINSPKQLGEILFVKMGLKGGKKTKTGYSTSADILEKLAPEYSIVKLILEYRQLSKLYSTYASGLSNYIAKDGRIHGSFNQKVTATGRISSTDPNLQNIPIRTQLGSKIRDIFISKDGYSFVDADYSQIELRVLASMANDEKLIESYKQGKDIHSITASNVFGVELASVTPELRRNAKAVNFGVVYGISAFGLSEDLSISRNEAKEYINNYFKTYPSIKAFLDNQVKIAKDKGYVKTLYGRIRPIPEIKSSNFMQRAFGDRIAMNSPIQGTAADIIKLAMISLDEELEKSGYDAKIVLQVHDELLVEALDEHAEEVKNIVEKCMKNVVALKAPLEVEAKVGKTWLKAKE